MNKPTKPAWLIYAEQCREQLANRRATKSGKREEDSMYRDWLNACRQYGYEGTEYDWQYLMGWRGRR